MADGKTLWDRREDETVERYAAFRLWMETGCLPFPRFVETQSVSLASLYRWSSRHEWRARATAWLAHLDGLAAMALSEKMEDQVQRQSRILNRALKWVESSLASYMEKGTRIPPDKMASFLKTVVELQRLIQDKATSRVELDLTGADVQSLDALHSQLKAIERNQNDSADLH